MKKLILGFAVTVGSLAFAQQATPPSDNPVTFGIKGGMNVSTLSKGADLNDSKSKTSFNAGVFANIPVASSFSVQPEVIYNALGSKVVREYNVQGIRHIDASSRNLGYISVPVMFQYNATPEFFIEAGPEFGFLVSARDKVESSTNDNTITRVNGLNKNDFNTFNFGIGLGAGYYFTKNLGVTARYTAGLTNVVKNRPSGSDGVRNNVFQVGLAFKFK